MHNLNINNYAFDLPKELIAQEPMEPRDKARLMILEPREIRHKHFYDIINEFKKGDLILLNNSKVIPSRIYGKKRSGGKIEALLIRDMSDQMGEKNIWLVILKGHGLRPKVEIFFNTGENELRGEILRWVENGKFLVKFSSDKDVHEIINKNGIIALPPYIKKKYNEFNMYQTVYSKIEGSIAAPTAGLHFTKSLLSQFNKKGIKIGYLTLHISASSFIPVSQENLAQSPIDPEYFTIPKETVELYNNATTNNSNIAVVGTTTMKAIESACDKNGKITTTEGYSDLFIYPGYKFHSKVNKFITNFHTPKSPPLLMVSAFCGWDRLKKAYQIAISNKYRFYSFGDAMLIIL